MELQLKNRKDCSIRRVAIYTQERRPSGEYLRWATLWHSKHLRCVSFPTNDQSDDETWPDQRKDKDNENDKDMRT